jgi:hypothetical protein
MASTYTTNKVLELPGNGDYVDTWNVPVNGDFTFIDTAFGGTTSLNATSGSVTLTSTQYRPLILSITGSISSDVTYTIPSGVGGQWIVNNATTTGNSSRVLIASGGGGTTQVAPRGSQVIMASNGTDIWLTAAGGGSGTGTVNSGTSGQISYYATTGTAVSGNANVTANNGALRLGVTGSAAGSLLLSGATTGTVTVNTSATSGTWTMTLPSAVPAVTGYVLSSDTSGNTSWVANGTGGGGVSTISFGSTGLTPATATAGAVTVAGTLGVANGGTGVTTSTGTGATVRATSPVLVTPALGIPSSGTLTNCTGLPLSGIVAASVGTFSSGDATLSFANNLQTLEINNGASNVVVYLPVLTVAIKVDIVQLGTGTVRLVTTGGSTVNSRVGTTIYLSAQYSGCTVYNGSNGTLGSWIAVGDIAPSA